MPKKDCTISIQVDRDTKERAVRLAEQANRSLSSYVRQLLRFHIREHEFLYGPISEKAKGFDEKSAPLSHRGPQTAAESSTQ